MMVMNRMIVPETVYGLYLWEMPNGACIADDDGNYLNIGPSRYGDPEMVKKLTDFVHNELGIYEGQPVFYPDRRRVSRGEWEDQMARMLDGETPDPYDPADIKGE